jgi:hypothetical protein
MSVSNFSIWSGDANESVKGLNAHCYAAKCAVHHGKPFLTKATKFETE